MKCKNTIIITVCVATALICVALTFWGNWKNDGILTTDAFIGIMATFIGICVTIIVGIQIVNHLELRNMKKSIKEIEDEKERLNEQQEAFSVEMHNTRQCIGDALALIALHAQKNNHIALEFNSWVRSIVIGDWTTTNASVLLKRYRRLTEIIEKWFSPIDKDLAELTYKQLSILEIPENIEMYEEIMSLHYKLLSELKKQTDKDDSEPDCSPEQQ